jgi:hypothetical protein
MRTTAIGLGGAAAAGDPLVAAARVARHSGVTGQEIDSELPGDDLVPGAQVVIDRATTLPAPPQRVWPWLVQLGKDRAGWYLPAWLELAIPVRRRGLRHIDAGLQSLAPGQDVAGAAGTRLHLRLRVHRIGNHAPALVASLAGLIDEATVRPMFAGLSERVR